MVFTSSITGSSLREYAGIASPKIHRIQKSHEKIHIAHYLYHINHRTIRMPSNCSRIYQSSSCSCRRSFLQDIAQNIAGDRLQVEYLVPAGIDPHTFELTPADAAKLEDANMLIINGGGLEEWLESSMDSLSADLLVVEASAGLESRETGGGEPDGDHHESDPHFWLKPSPGPHLC